MKWKWLAGGAVRALFAVRRSAAETHDGKHKMQYVVCALPDPVYLERAWRLWMKFWQWRWWWRWCMPAWGVEMYLQQTNMLFKHCCLFAVYVVLSCSSLPFRCWHRARFSLCKRWSTEIVVVVVENCALRLAPRARSVHCMLSSRSRSGGCCCKAKEGVYSVIKDIRGLNLTKICRTWAGGAYVKMIQLLSVCIKASVS